MARITGPLMSLDASGSFGSTLVFGKWKGRNVVRQLVVPSNPRSTTQVAARNKLRVTAEGQHWVNFETSKSDGNANTDKVRITNITPAGQAWNGFLVNTMIGDNSAEYTTAGTAYAALAAAEKTAWNTSAGALSPAIADVQQFLALNAPGVAVAKGEVFFRVRYAMFRMGIAPAPGAVPTVYT